LLEKTKIGQHADNDKHRNFLPNPIKLSRQIKWFMILEDSVISMKLIIEAHSHNSFIDEKKVVDA
jgi:hypothetical protein